MGRHLSPRYGQVILVRGYPVLTAVNWSQYWCPICVHYQFSCALKLARKHEIEHWSRSIKTINWSADSFQINHVTSMSWHMTSVSETISRVLTHDIGQWLSYFDSCQLNIFWMSNIKDVDLPRRAWDTPPSFDSLPYPTRTIYRRLRTNVCSTNNVTTKQKEVDIFYEYEALSQARFARLGTPPLH